MSKKSPLGTLKKQFGDDAKEAKKKLVAEVEKFAKSDDLWVNRTNADKGLAHVSNTKLLRLHAIFTEVKGKFGTRAKLIEAIADIEKRSKDDGFKARLGAYPVPRLFDLYKSADKRAKAAAAKPAPVKAEKKAAKPAKAAAKK